MKHLELALSYYGITEVYGPKANQIILDWAEATDSDWLFKDDSGENQAWCGLYVGYILSTLNYKIPKHFYSARSWEKGIGRKVKNPKTGDIVVFWRGSPTSGKGHVGFYINHTEDGKHIYTLGGNQKNQVNIDLYNASRVVGYRRISKPSIAPLNIPKPRFKRVTAYFLNIRKSGRKNSDTVSDPLPKGTYLKVLEEKGNWARVQVINQDIQGWVSLKHIG